MKKSTSCPEHKMEAINYINKTREYLNYLEEHINNVQKAWEEIKTKCYDMHFIYDDYLYFWLDRDVQLHDLSKFSKDEFVQYRQKFYPVEEEDIIESDFDIAWMHHYTHNNHHWENWAQQDYTNPHQWVICCVHMVIDWLAMSYKFKDTPRNYYEKHKDEIMIPDFAIKFIYEIFERLEK